MILVVFTLILAGSWSTAPANADSQERTGAVLAQLHLPNVFGGASDLPVKVALASFGKSLARQLPIASSPDDAYPTTLNLPGGAFAPSRRASTIARQLHDSRDGTIPLRPGDYSFVVDVFCMKAHATSPSAHSYLVAALHGSAADIITALNSRLPSFALDHHAVQVLSWNIQAGLPYGSMQAPQRSIVDKVVPDYRDRLSGDVYQRIRDQYSQISTSVPGMPSFEDALVRLGPAGEAVTTLQALRQQLSQPAPSYAELARSLVPEAPAMVATVVQPSGTPWSRYSDRVFVRFVTTGNYATPGTYQVRVLPGPSGDGGSGVADVPFANIINDPGTPTVQPLTQVPDVHS